MNRTIIMLWLRGNLLKRTKHFFLYCLGFDRNAILVFISICTSNDSGVLSVFYWNLSFSKQ